MPSPRLQRLPTPGRCCLRVSHHLSWSELPCPSTGPSAPPWPCQCSLSPLGGPCLSGEGPNPLALPPHLVPSSLSEPLSLSCTLCLRLSSGCNCSPPPSAPPPAHSSDGCAQWFSDTRLSIFIVSKSPCEKLISKGSLSLGGSASLPPQSGNRDGLPALNTKILFPSECPHCRPGASASRAPVCLGEGSRQGATLRPCLALGLRGG